MIWNLENKTCSIVDICVPLDVNVEREEKVKRDRYLVLAAGLKRIYSGYSYNVIPIVVGATGYIPKTLVKYLVECGFEEKKAKNIIPELQRKALRGSMKVLKTALKMKR